MPEVDVGMGSPVHIKMPHMPFNFNFSDIAFSDHTSTNASHSSTDIYPTPQQSCQHDETLALHPINDLALDLNDCAGGLGPLFSASFEDRSPTSSARELFDLCGDIVEDHEILTSGFQSFSQPGSADYLEAEVQRVLNRTSRLSEVVKGVIPSATTPPPQDGNNMRHGNQSRPQVVLGEESTIPTTMPPRRNPHDVLLRTSVVTAYMYMVRNWRRTFVHIHDLLASAPVETNGVESLMLPGLQLGGFHVHNIPNIQIVVLLELSSAMMRTIKEYLGISTGFGPERGFLRTDVVEPGQGHTCALGMDPVSMSIGELLASQESHRPVSSDNFGKLSLEDMMAEIRSQLNTQT